ncbi:unnamed protein product, partial [Laminaria digitata]
MGQRRAEDRHISCRVQELRQKTWRAEREAPYNSVWRWTVPDARPAVPFLGSILDFVETVRLCFRFSCPVPHLLVFLPEIYTSSFFSSRIPLACAAADCGVDEAKGGGRCPIASACGV